MSTAHEYGQSPENEVDPVNERKRRIEAAAEFLEVEIDPIEQNTPELTIANASRYDMSKQLPAGMQYAEHDLVGAVKQNQTARLESMGYRMDTAGTLEIAPEQHILAHEVTKVVANATNVARSRFQASLNPKNDKHQWAIPVLDSLDDVYAFDKEQAVLKALGVTHEQFTDASPETAETRHNGSTSYVTEVKAADGVLLQQTVDLDQDNTITRTSYAIHSRGW